LSFLKIKAVAKMCVFSLTQANRQEVTVIRVGTKVFAFVFSRKFSRNSLFVFAKTKFLILRKLRGKNHSTANFVYSITKNIGNESEQRENDVVLQQISWGRKFRFRFFRESFREKLTKFRENQSTFRQSFCFRERSKKWFCPNPNSNAVTSKVTATSNYFESDVSIDRLLFQDFLLTSND
jgi:hypothetical protein